MQNTKEMLQKATMQVSDITVGEGKLRDEQAKEFIDYTMDESMMEQLGVRVVRFKAEQKDFPKLAVKDRAVYPASEGIDPNWRRGITSDKFTVRHDKIIIPWEITEDLLWYNVENESLADHVMRSLADTARNNFETMCFESNVLGHAAIEADIMEAVGASTTDYVKDGFLAFSNGWLEQAGATHKVNNTYDPIDLSTFSQMKKELPNKFKRDLNKLVFLTSPDVEQDFRMHTSARMGSFGDLASSTSKPLTPFGIPLIPVPLFPSNPKVTEHLAFTGSGSTITTKYANISGVVVTPTTLASVATAAYTSPGDYTVNTTTGVITHAGGGSTIGDNDTVKVTYAAAPQVILTRRQNLVFVMSMDLKLKQNESIYRDVLEFVMHARVGCGMEETDLAVLCHNIQLRTL